MPRANTNKKTRDFISPLVIQGRNLLEGIVRLAKKWPCIEWQLSTIHTYPLFFIDLTGRAIVERLVDNLHTHIMYNQAAEIAPFIIDCALKKEVMQSHDYRFCSFGLWCYLSEMPRKIFVHFNFRNWVF